MQLYSRAFGQRGAPTLLLLHGGGLSGRQWQPQTARLTAYRCLVPDLPGHGNSAAMGVVGLPETAAYVLETLNHSEGRGARVHLVGSSFGGLVALHLLNVAPERVATVMVTGSAVGLGRVLGAVAKASSSLYRFFSTETLVKLSYAQFGIPEPYREMFQDDLRRTANADFARKLTTAMRQFQLPTEVPVLAAVGQYETLFAKRAARKIAASLPNALAVMAPQVGHVWNLQAPDLFAETVRAWTAQTVLPTELQPLR